MLNIKKEKKEKDGEIFSELTEAKKKTDEELNIKSDEGILEDTPEDEGQLTVDVYQDGDMIIIESAVAGVNPDNLEINITSESITIKGRRERHREIEEKDYFYQECFWGAFSRSIILPEGIDPDKSEAKLTNNGILTIRLPKLKRKKPKKVEIKVEN